MLRAFNSVLPTLLLKCWSAVCSGISNGSMLPKNPYVLIGDNLTLTCSHFTKDNASLIILGPYDSEFPPEYLTEVSPHVLQLDLPIKNESWQGKMINCFDDSDSNFNRGQILKVECQIDGNMEHNQYHLDLEKHPPRDMTNVTALIDNWKTLNISWSIPKYFDMANITVDVKWKTLSGWYNCSEGSSITNCFINETEFLECPVYWLRINITNTEADASHVQNVTIPSNRYVRAAPPEGLSTTTSSRCLTATWENIREKTQIWAYTVNLDNMTISRGEVDNRTVTICHLRPDTEYVLSVTSKPIASIYWSLPSRITTRTAEDKPDAGVPVMDGGYYVKNSCKGGRRTLVIFLTTPSRNTWNGNLTEYNILYISLNGRKEKPKVIPVTSLNDTVDLKCAVAYTMKITLYNGIGASPTSELRIPVDGAVSKPTRVRVRITGGTGELEWMKEGTVHSQAMFWCQGTLIPFSCKGRTNWKSVAETENSTSIAYATGNIYGVSITTDNGSSDIAWADCTYILEKEPPTVPQRLSDIMPSQNSLTVRWNPEICSDNVLVTHYIIEHCDVDKITGCVMNMVRSEEGLYSIPDLTAGVNYSVRLRKVTVDGKEGEYSDHVYATPLFPDSGGNALQILAVILGVLGFLAIIIGIVRFRKLKLKEPIVMPRSDQALDDATTLTSIPNVVVEENGVDPIKEASEKLIAQENRLDSGSSIGSTPKETHSAETHFSSKSELKEPVQVQRDSGGSCGDSKIIKEERAPECHDEEEKDTSEQVDVVYSIVAGRDDEQEQLDEEEEANQEDEDTSNVDAEELDKC